MWQQDCGALEALCAARRSAFRGGAFSYAGRRISRRTLFRQKEDCARALVRWGISVGDPVLLCAVATPESFALLLALWKLGAVPHLLDPERPSGELAKAVRRSGARLLLVTDQFLPRLEAALGVSALLQVVVLPLGRSMPRNARLRLPQTSLSGLGILPFKDFLASGRRIPVAPGIVLSCEALAAVAWRGLEYDEECRTSHGKLASMVGGWKESFGSRKNAVLGMLPPWSLSGLSPLLAALDMGVIVILEPDTKPEAIAATLLRERPPWVLVTPALWRGLWEQPKIAKAELAFLEKLWVGMPEGEAIPEGGSPLYVFFPCSVEIIIV